METMTNPEQLEKTMMQLGRNLATRFFVLFKTAQNYSEGHAALTIPVRQFLDVIRSLQRMNAEASLRFKGGYLFLGDLRLKPDSTGFESFNFVMEEMTSCFTGGIAFSPDVTEADISGFFFILLRMQPGPPAELFVELQSQLSAARIIAIEVEPMADEIDFTVSTVKVQMDSKSRARRIYFQAIAAVDEIMESAVRGKALRLAKTKRIVQGMLDQILADPADLVGFTTLRCNHKYSGNHPVNVAILSMLIGLQAGLTKSRCCELGLVALCHDIGKTILDYDLLDKAEEFSPEEWQEMQKHPLLSVKLLMELKQFDSLSARMIAAAFEHHLRHDFTGYPKVPYRKIGAFSRIIAIADDFDALTSARVYQREPHAPEKVIRYMLSRSGRNYDPVFLKIFVNVAGIYPIGTLLLLESRELAIVVRNKRALDELAAPWAKVIATPQGVEPSGVIVDTADTSAGRAILGTIDPVPLRMELSGYFI